MTDKELFYSRIDEIKLQRDVNLLKRYFDGMTPKELAPTTPGLGRGGHKAKMGLSVYRTREIIYQNIRKLRFKHMVEEKERRNLKYGPS